MGKIAKKYHIIGGGIAGLCAAKKIKAQNKNAYVIIYEAANQLGGRCFSFYDEKLQTRIDNATHVVVGANKDAVSFLEKRSFSPSVYFFDMHTKKMSSSLLGNKEDIALGIFNRPFREIPTRMKWEVLKRLFPFFGFRKKVYFSKNNLSETFISPLEKYADEIRFGMALRDFKTKDDKIICLTFGKERVEIAENDVVVSAMDAKNYVKIFGGEEFEFESIINIFYRTSMKITLPNNVDLIGIKNGLAQWIFCNKDTLSVTISAANGIILNEEELAVKVWQEVCEIRGREAAFLPPYRVIHAKEATIKQDIRNNALRVKNAKPKYKNLKVVGDWTVANFPSSIEAAMLSAKFC